MSHDVIPFPEPTAAEALDEHALRHELATLRRALSVSVSQLAHERERLAAALSESHSVRARLGRLERTLWYRATRQVSRALGRDEPVPAKPRRHLRSVPAQGLDTADWE